MFVRWAATGRLVYVQPRNGILDVDMKALREAIEAVKPPQGGFIVRTVATGLTKAGAVRPELKVLRTGTDNVPFMMGGQDAVSAPLNSAASMGGSGISTPAIWRSNRTHAAARVDGMANAGMDDIEIPAFLRKQAD